MLRKIVATLILLPLAIVMIAFAVANRQIVTVSLDPFGGSTPAASLTLPLFALVIVLLIFGVLIGGLAAWVRQGRWRSAARRWERQAQALRKKLEAHEGAASGPAIVPDGGELPPQRLQLRPPAR
ncbi:MAG: LapA family protein [Xanthobacteraceae bacterium]